ncbi:helix-turn-helix domain-containing protein [Rhodocytophaga aerolata]|uniref:Helix-turn-helix domain-containing protein n=1 Tax=Rhodocytophaga aerolata TaxID=455078 RepID=A0ABT8R116_9BACT|nr:helix-turn-helix domain-containing protein [Rhodocytophaga aerolata]MDO1445784.1 helix-turn-helix domain-containing protein [Rhodocytophaga aerolata]
MPTVTPFIDLLSLGNLLGAVQGVFLAAIFFAARKNNRYSNFLLASLLFFLSLDIFEIFLCYTNYIFYVPWMVNIAEPFSFLYGPFAYFYARSLTSPEFRFERKHIPYFVPALLYFIYRIPFYLQSNAFKLHDVIQSYQKPYSIDYELKPIAWFPDGINISGEWFDVVLFIWSLPFNMYSIYLAYSYARSHRISLLTTQNTSLKWLVLTTCYLTLTFIVFGLISFTDTRDLGDIYIATAMSLVLYGMSFYVIVKSQVLDHKQVPVPAEVPQPEAKRKYEKSALPTELADDMLPRLKQYMEQQKPFLNSELGLPELAAALSISTHHLSQLINEGLGQNFFDFINSYRIDEIKKQLHDPKLSHIKIEEIAFQNGFNSKSAFNTAFKKFTQTTPSQFRKSISVS